MTGARKSPIEGEVREQRVMGWWMLAIGVAFIAVFVFVALPQASGWESLAPPAIGVGFILYGRRSIRAARTRRHGMASEKRAMARIGGRLSRRGMVVEENVRVPGLGDIDMVLRKHGATIPVEIKSFQVWNPREKRAKSALAQTDRAVRRTQGAHGILWLPDASVGWWKRWRGERHGHLWVAFGHARNLARVAERRFPNQPE